MGNWVILVVEDTQALLDVFIETLALHFGDKVKIITAKDGIEALAQVDRWRGRIDLIMTDQSMPRMNGERFVKEVLDLYPHLEHRIVLVSGSHPRPNYFLDGEFPILNKPVSIYTYSAEAERILTDIA